MTTPTIEDLERDKTAFRCRDCGITVFGWTDAKLCTTCLEKRHQKERDRASHLSIAGRATIAVTRSREIVMKAAPQYRRLRIKGHRLIRSWQGTASTYAHGYCECGQWTYRTWTERMRDVIRSHNRHLQTLTEKHVEVDQHLVDQAQRVAGVCFSAALAILPGAAHAQVYGGATGDFVGMPGGIIGTILSVVFGVAIVLCFIAMMLDNWDRR